MARTDTLQHFLTDVANSIRGKTGGSSPIEADHFDTEIDSISGGGYDGQLPQNSTITNLVCIGSDIRVYLAVDALADGTRIYYKENALPTLNDSYIDVPANASYAVIPNVNANSMYGFRCAAYVIYDTDQKAFNNAQSLGSYAVKLTTIFNSEGAILLDIPVEDQGNAIGALCYSEYSKKVYLFINAHLYKLDVTSATPGWERIGTDYTFSSSASPRLCPTSAGVFLAKIRSSGNLLLYKEDTDTFVDTGISQNYYINELSNGDIITVVCYDSYYGTYQKFNKTTNTFSNLIGYNHYMKAAYDNTVKDNSNGIFISFLYQDGTNMLPTRVLKYNDSTHTYDLVGQFPKPGSSQTSAWISFGGVIPLIGYSLYTDSNNTLYKLVNGTFTSLGNFRYNGQIAQDPNNPEIIYAVGSPGSVTGNLIYKINVNTIELESLYTLSGYYSMQRKVTYYDEKILAPSGASSYGSAGFYDIPTSTWYGSGLTNKGSTVYYDTLFKVINGKCYGFSKNVIRYDKTESSFALTTLGTIAQNTNYEVAIRTIQNGDKIYLYDAGSSYTNSRVGVWKLNITTDTLTQLTSTPYNRAVVRDNKIYFLASQTNVAQFIVDLTDDSYSVSQYVSGSTYFANLGNPAYTSGYSLDNKTKMSSYIDTTLKKITSFNKDLLDYSASTKTFSVQNYTSFTYKYTGAYLVDADKTELIICFTE